MNLAKAQAELDQDEVDDGKEDLPRAGGDQQARIQSLTQQHEAASQISDNTKVAVTPPNEKRGLIHRFQQWSALHRKQMQLWRAKAEAESAAATFSAAHNALDSKVSAKNKGLSNAPAPTECDYYTRGEGFLDYARTISGMLQLTKSRSQDQKALSTFDKRVEDQTQLAAYTKVDRYCRREAAQVSELCAARNRHHPGHRPDWSLLRWMDRTPSRQNVDGPASGGNFAHGPRVASRSSRCFSSCW